MEIDDFTTQGARQTSVYLPNDLWVSAKQNLIEFKQAMIFGIKFLLAEKQGFDYPENKLLGKIKVLQRAVTEAGEEIYKLENSKKEENNINKVDAEKEADEILGGLIDGNTKE